MFIKPVAVGVAALALAASTGPGPGSDATPAEPPRAAIRAADVALAFERNVGQTDPSVRWLARGPRSTLFVTDEAAVLAFLPRDGRPRSVAMHLGEDAARLEPQASGPPCGPVNLYLGDDPSRWRTGIPTSAVVRSAGVWPGIDLALHGTRGRFEYDFLVAPGADPSRIAVTFDGADDARLDRGALILDVEGAEVRHEPPTAWQTGPEGRRPVACAWQDRGGDSFGFRVGALDPALPLVIDPVIVFSTYLGGLGADEGEDVAVGEAGHVYVVGTTTSLDFPVAGAEQSARQGTRSAFVTKVDETGRRILFSTYLGGATNPIGDAETFGRAIALDDEDAAYVTGWTRSIDFPTTDGAFQEDAPGARRTLQGTIFEVNADAFVTKLSSDGVLVWSSYLGGTGELPEDVNADDFGTGIALDANNAAYVTGQTLSTRFPTTGDASQPVDPDAVFTGGAIFGNRHDVFFVRLAPGGSTLSHGTYLGGTADDGGPGGRLAGGTGGIALDPFGNVYLAGRTESGDFPTSPNAFQQVRGGGYDAFLARFSRLQGEEGLTFALSYSTYLGGTGDEGSLERSEFGVSAQRLGRAFVAGDTRSADFPTTSGAFQRERVGEPGTDAFVAKFHTTSSTRLGSLEFSTYLGGTADDLATAIGVESGGRVRVAGRTRSIDFPVASEIQQFLRGAEDAFVATLSADGRALPFSTYLGGRDVDGAAGLTFREPDDVYVTGSTASDDLPLAGVPAQDQFRGGPSDAFLLKLSDELEPVAHDLAVLAIAAPRRVRLTDRSGARTVTVAVRIQNRSTHAETITDMDMLAQVVRLTVQSLGTCPEPVATLRPGQARRLPMTLLPGQRARIAFAVTFDCANDAQRSTRKDPGHDDFTFAAQVFHEAIDGLPDDHTIDDACPREPMNVPDPFPNGTLRVRGCPAVFLDVEDRRTAQ